ncbi:MAG: hypothetical protein JWP79_916 [Polaromonas sp.]|nr:hypothetical protein [Polaromonas sp.]MDB5843606.1 hypothetical protein [Polaromonas sp.]
MKFLDRLWLGCSVLALLLPVAVKAQTAAPQADESTQPGRHPAGFSGPVALAMLEQQRGGAQGMSIDLKLSGMTAGNSAAHVATGTNDISAGAFANMSGLPVVIQNSGANVLIQNAVIVNLQMN